MDESGFQVYPGLPSPYQEGVTFDDHVESTETAAARAWGSPVSDPASPDSLGSVSKRRAVTNLGGNGDRGGGVPQPPTVRRICPDEIDNMLGKNSRVGRGWWSLDGKSVISLHEFLTS